jgi:hypothetical protein
VLKSIRQVLRRPLGTQMKCAAMGTLKHGKIVGPLRNTGEHTPPVGCAKSTELVVERPKMIYRINTDCNGNEAIQHLINANLVTDIECRDYIAYDKAVQKLASTVKPTDCIIVDTINRAAEMFLYWQFIGIRLKPGQSPSDLKDVTNPSNTLSIYGQIPFYVVETLRGIPCQLIILAQEGDKFFNAETGRMVKWDKESATGALPDALAPEGLVQGVAARLSAAAMRAVGDMTSDTFGLRRLMSDEVGVSEDGTEKKYKRGTRCLNVSDTVAILAKIHVAIEQYRKLRDSLYHPTLPKLYTMLGVIPKVLLFYGANGTGKTTLACSIAEAEYRAKEKKNV